MILEVDDRLAKEIESVMVTPLTEAALARMLTLVRRELYICWRLGLQPDLPGDWWGFLDAIAENAGIEKPSTFSTSQVGPPL